jgi:hypothetical protein
VNPSNLFNKTATRVNVTTAKDATGFLTQDTVQTTQTFRCALQTTGASDALVYGRERGIATFVLFCPIGTTLLLKDRVTIDTVTYRVIGQGQDEAGRSNFLKFILELES